MEESESNMSGHPAVVVHHVFSKIFLKFMRKTFPSVISNAVVEGNSFSTILGSKEDISFQVEKENLLV